MRHILSVGQCGFDHNQLVGRFSKEFSARIDGADTFDEAIGALREGNYDLVLVNRVTDADGSLGVDLIRTLKADPALSATPVILVSNVEGPQREAESLGALPGFGKADLRTPKASECVARALAVTQGD